MKYRKIVDRTASSLMFLASLLIIAVLLVIMAGLYLKSLPILKTKSLTGILSSTDWHPLRGEFGLLPFIAGTLWVTVLAGLISVPLSLMTAIYLAEFAPSGVRGIFKPVMDILAGIPSVVYGLWGVLFLSLGGLRIGFNVLAGAIVLAIMVIPLVTAIAQEVFSMVPRDVKEASLALGANKWETAKFVVIRGSLPGLIAAVILGFSRALGETMAVLMVVGNVAKVPSTIFDPAYPLTALMANNYGEMLSVPLYDSAVMLAALVLFAVVAVFNALARFSLLKIRQRQGL